MSHFRKFLSYFFLIVFSLLSAHYRAAAADRSKVIIGYSAMQAPIAPLWIAQEQGFFSKYAIEPELIFVRIKISDQSAAEQGYQSLQRDLDITLYTPVEGLQNLQRFMRAYNPRINEVKAAELVDDSVLKQLSQTGFVEKVYRSYGVN